VSSSKESENNVEIEKVSMDCDLLISEFGGLQREAVLELLAQCIVQLSPTQQTVLAMYYHENLEPTEIGARLDLTECEIEQVRVEMSGLLRTMLAAQIGVPELPGNFDNDDADDAGVLVNG
jgi:DNA-directed RNA polymerase specialized sigma subunit